MSLISDEIRELRQMNKDLSNGKIDHKLAAMKLKVYREIAAREKMVLEALKLTTLKGITLNKISEFGLISPGEVLDVDYLGEFIYCPDVGRKITRLECVDLSGDSENYKTCRDCKFFDVNRKIVLSNSDI